MRSQFVMLVAASSVDATIVPTAKMGCVAKPETGINLCSAIFFETACSLDPRCEWKLHIPAFCGPNLENGVGINGCSLLKSKFLCEKDPLNLISTNGPRCIWNEQVIEESNTEVPNVSLSCVANEGVGINGCRFLKFESLCNKDPRCGWKKHIPGFCAPTVEGSLNACKLLPFKAACEHDILNVVAGSKRCMWNEPVTEAMSEKAAAEDTAPVEHHCVAAEGVGINGCQAIPFEKVCNLDPRCTWKAYTPSYCAPNTAEGVTLNGCKFLKLKFLCEKDLLDVVAGVKRCIWHEGSDDVPAIVTDAPESQKVSTSAAPVIPEDLDTTTVEPTVTDDSDDSDEYVYTTKSTLQETKNPSSSSSHGLCLAAVIALLYW